MIYYQKGSPDSSLDEEDIQEALTAVSEHAGTRGKVLALPPDFTRYHSFAGQITCQADQMLGSRLTEILPATGTHFPMSGEEISRMYPGIDRSKFRVHDWRRDAVRVGEVPGDFVSGVTSGLLNDPWPAQVNKLLLEGRHEMILSIGQVVPHEVIGMANHNKNIFVGTGGQEGINKSHFIGAVYGMERMMGRAETPVRQILNYASRNFTPHLPLVYMLTVVGRDEEGRLKIRGLFAGDDEACFREASALSLRVNFTLLDEALKKVVVYLDPSEYKTTWLGNKSIYRTRMAIADGGELIILAPGVRQFGEDMEIDRLIRKYGYRTSREILSLVKRHDDLKSNLGAAAHLIHGSPENRFKITYCAGKMDHSQIQEVGFHHADTDDMMNRYPPAELKEGWNRMPDGEEFYYISNPALGLWSTGGRFETDN